MTTLKVLSADTIRLIGSTQVITSVSSVVKELIENSLDAGATSIDIKLENYGLDRIEIKDNGKGIPEEDIPYLAKRHYTSKISTFSDLEQLFTYGFRGEALASLCSVSEVTVTTRTLGEAAARSLLLSKTGDILSSKLSPQPEGTTISAAKLFKNLPVRQQYSKNDKRRKEELKKVENLVMAFGIINPKIRFTLRHNKDVVWQKAAVDTIRSAMLAVWGYNVVQLLEHQQQAKEDPRVSVEMFTPKCASDVMIMSKTGGDQGFIYVNKRPVNLKHIQKTIRQYYSDCHRCDANRYPLFVISITLPQNEVDVNLDPNKTQVLIHNNDIVMDVITILLEKLYGPLGSVPPRKQVDDSKCDRAPTSHTTDKTNATQQILDTNSIKTTHPVPHSEDTFQPHLGSLSSPRGSELETQALDVKHGSSDRNSMDIVNKTPESPLSSKTEITCNLSSPSTDKPSLNVNSFHLELSPNIQDQVPESNSLNDQNPGIDVVTPNVSSLGSEKPNSTMCDSELFDQLLGSFNLETPAAPAEPAPAAETEALKSNGRDLDDSLEADNFFDSINEPIDREIWSRGKMKSEKGGLVQPIQLFAPSAHHTPGKRPPSPSHDSPLEPVAKRKAGQSKLNLMDGQTTLYDLVESQPVKRPETAFVLFSKQIRPKIIEENPNADYMKISELVVKRWKSLTQEEIKEFNNLCEKDIERYEEQMQLAKKKAANKIINSKSKVSTKLKSSHTPPREKLVKPCKVTVEAPSKQECIKVKVIPFSMEKLKTKMSYEYNCSSQCSWSSSDHLVPIGYLPSRDAWVCHQGVQLRLFNPHRANEVLVYQKLMESFQVNADHLEKPIILNDKFSGSERIWKTLMSLKCENHAVSCHQVVIDQRLISNGFTVAIHKELSPLSSNSCQVEITGLASSIPMFGIKDLYEVLENIATIGPATSLMQCRPLKIVNYLKSEAVRIARNSPSFSSKQVINDLLEKVEHIRKWNCLHDKPFIHDIYNLGDLPFSQESLMESQDYIS